MSRKLAARSVRDRIAPRHRGDRCLGEWPRPSPAGSRAACPTRHRTHLVGTTSGAAFGIMPLRLQTSKASARNRVARGCVLTSQIYSPGSQPFRPGPHEPTWQWDRTGTPGNCSSMEIATPLCNLLNTRALAAPGPILDPGHTGPTPCPPFPTFGPHRAICHVRASRRADRPSHRDNYPPNKPRGRQSSASGHRRVYTPAPGIRDEPFRVRGTGTRSNDEPERGDGPVVPPGGEVRAGRVA